MTTRSLGVLTADVVLNTGGFVKGADEAERSLDKLTKAEQRQERSLQRLIAQLDPVAAEYKRVEQQAASLQRHFEQGRIGVEQFNRLNASLTKTRDSLNQTATQFNKGRITAKEMAFAIRGLPAQFTDIFVSLQAGQAPLTVLLQQGGQLKDMFGGIGPAARVLGQYIIGLVTPVTTLAAAVAALGLAWLSATKESREFGRAIILTGGAAGKSAGELQDLAAKLDNLPGTTQGEASAALAALANTAGIAADQIEAIGTAALLMQDATGKAVEETIKEFAAIGEDPVRAAGDLLTKQKLITAEEYSYVRALVERGEEQKAVDEISRIAAGRLSARALEAIQNNDAFTQSLKNTGSAFKEVWDGIIGLFRTETIAEEIERLQALSKSVSFGFTGQASPSIRPDQEARLQFLLKEQQAEKDIFEQRRKNAEVQASAKKALDAVVIANRAALSEEEKRVLAVETYLRNVEKARAGLPNDRDLAPDRVAATVAFLERDPNADKAAKKAADEIKNIIDGLKEQEQMFGKSGVAADVYRLKILKASPEIVKLAESIAASITEMERAADVADFLTNLEKQANAAGLTATALEGYEEAIKAANAADAERLKSEAVQKAAEDLELYEAALKGANAAELESIKLAQASRAANKQRETDAQRRIKESEESQKRVNSTLEKYQSLIVGLDPQIIAYNEAFGELQEAVDAGAMSQETMNQILSGMEASINMTAIQEYIEGLKQIATMDNLVIGSAEAASEAITGYLYDIAEGSKTANQALKDFARGFALSMAQIAARALATYAVLQLLRAAGYEGIAQAIQQGVTIGAQGNAAGGYISGPGTGTSDSIPAMLSNGEYVINAKSVRTFGKDFFDNLNRGNTPQLPRYATGGMVSAPRTATQPGGGVGSIRIVNVPDTDARMGGYLGSAAGERQIINVMRRNSATVRQIAVGAQ